MKDEEKIYAIIAIAAFLSILITGYFVITVKTDPLPFTEIYFTNHSALPETILLNNNYSFSYAIESKEKKRTEVNTTAVVELYRIFDVTEGTYQCIPEGRDQIRLKWKEGLVFTNETLEEMQIENFNVIEPFVTISVENLEEEYIEWEDYVIESHIASEVGKGQLFMTYLDEEGNVDYAVGVDLLTNRSILYRDGIVETAKGKFPADITSIRIVMEDGLMNITYRDSLQKYRPLHLIRHPYKKGRVFFQTLNMLVDMRRKTLVYELTDQLFKPKDASKILEYALDFEDLKVKKTEWNEKKTDPIDIYLAPTENTPILDRIAEAPLGTTPSYTLQPVNLSKEENIIPWDNFTLSFTYKKLFGPGVFATYIMDDENLKYGVVINEESEEVQWVTNTNGKLSYSVAALPITSEGEYKVRVHITTEEAHISVNENELISAPMSVTPQGKILFNTKFTQPYLSAVLVESDDPECQETFVFKKCRKKYNVRNQGSDFTKREIPATRTYEDDASFEDEDVLVALIEDQRIQFDGTNAKIVDLTNYTFNFNYLIYEGERQITLSFENFEGEKLYSIELYEKLNTSVFINHVDDTSEYFDTNFTSSETGTHDLQVNYDNGNMTLVYDYVNTFFNRTGLDMSNGYFAIETRRTQADFSAARVVNHDKEEDIRNFRIQTDPCQLRKVGQQILYKDTLLMNPEDHKNFDFIFSVDTKFDFGKVTATANEQEIHFWVKRE